MQKVNESARQEGFKRQKRSFIGSKYVTNKTPQTVTSENMSIVSECMCEYQVQHVAKQQPYVAHSVRTLANTNEHGQFEITPGLIYVCLLSPNCVGILSYRSLI